MYESQLEMIKQFRRERVGETQSITAKEEEAYIFAKSELSLRERKEKEDKRQKIIAEETAERSEKN